MGNRIEALRKLRGNMTQAQLAELVHTTPSQIGKLERGERRLTADWQQKIARALDCAAGDLLVEGDMLSVPIQFSVHAAFSDAADPLQDHPYDRLPALPGLAQPHQCVAARVDDNSADRLYPRGSMLIIRVREYTPQMHIGQKVLIVRRQPLEMLVGVLDRGTTGDLIAHMRSTLRDLPAAVVIQTAPRLAGISERFQSIEPQRASTIDYVPSDDDPAQIVGTVAMAITPE